MIVRYRAYAYKCSLIIIIIIIINLDQMYIAWPKKAIKNYTD